MDLFQKTMEPVEKVLRDAKMDKASIHEVVSTTIVIHSHPGVR